MEGAFDVTHRLDTLLGMIGQKWPNNLPKPVDPLDNTILARAQSLLTGAPIGVCPPLTIEQARDVLAWHELTRTVDAARGIA
jgi:hypothetical protein